MSYRQSPIWEAQRQYNAQARYKRKKLTRSNKRVGGYVGMETKFHDAGIASVATGVMAVGGLSIASRIAPTPAQSLFTIPGGTGVSERNGRLMVVTGCLIRGTVQVPELVPATAAAAFLAAQPIRVCWALVLDKQTNNAIMTADQVYSSMDITTVAVSAADQKKLGVIAPVRDLEHSARYTILDTGSKMIPAIAPVIYDSTLAVSTYGLPAREVGLEINHSCNIPFRYQDTAAQLGQIGEMSDNSMHLLVWTNNTGAVAPLFSGGVRTRFHSAN